MGKRKTTQEDRVLRHLKEFGSITTWEAIKEYGITRLSAKIFDLRKQGEQIEKVTETGTNRFSEPTWWAKYIYVPAFNPKN